MTSQGFLGAILVGLVIGALGRLVVPGRQPIGCLLTILLGIAGSVAGLAIANQLDVTWWLLVLAFQVAVAAIGVAIVASALHRRR
ncbi:MAG: GlsB/YeaQ/YmgE family stress response membrane protein [Sporichthyaceae bacterium]